MPPRFAPEKQGRRAAMPLNINTLMGEKYNSGKSLTRSAQRVPALCAAYSAWPWTSRASSCSAWMADFSRG